MLAEFQSYFDLLSRELPFRFAPNLERVRNDLPSLFSKALPFVLSHGDLNTMNLLVNPETGNITGIVDWAESRILPFGFALYGLENLLGWMDSEGWHYYDHYRELESLFWQTFREKVCNFSGADFHLIRSARMAGLFYHYGFDLTKMVWCKVCAWTTRMVRLHILMLSVLPVNGLQFCRLVYDKYSLFNLVAHKDLTAVSHNWPIRFSVLDLSSEITVKMGNSEI